MGCESENHATSMAGSNEASQSLIFEENQNTLLEHEKSFISMNMEELVSSVWINMNDVNQAKNIEHVSLPDYNLHGPSSLALPSPLSRKTVEEVLLEIHREEDEPPQRQVSVNPVYAPHRPEFGKMTLEEFLINAGVLWEMGRPPSCTSTPPLQQFKIFPDNDSVLSWESWDFVGCPNFVPSAGFGETSGLGGTGEVNGCFFGGKIGVDGCGVCGSQGDDSLLNQGLASGFCPSQVVDTAGRGGLEIRGLKRRAIDEWVVGERGSERRQKRMIKNRESAARSRARKQAYTIELQAELEQLKEEIVRLTRVLEEATAMRCKKLIEAAKEIPISAAERHRKVLRRTMSCQW